MYDQWPIGSGAQAVPMWPTVHQTHSHPALKTLC
jgi:hypothetical protein